MSRSITIVISSVMCALPTDIEVKDGEAILTPLLQHGLGPYESQPLGSWLFTTDHEMTTEEWVELTDLIPARLVDRAAVLYVAARDDLAARSEA